MRGLKVLVVLLMVVVAAPSCVGRRGPGSSFRAESPSGDVQVRAPGTSDWVALSSGRRVTPEDEVRTRDGSVALARDDGARIELGRYTSLRVDRVTELTLEAGRVLIVVPEIPVEVEAQGVHAQARKAMYRVEAGYSIRVGSYGGEVTVSQDADRVTLGDFRQVEITGGVFQRDPLPMRISPSDDWDRKLLSDALDLDRQLRQYGRVFLYDFAAQARNPLFYVTLVPGLPQSAIESLLRTRADPADLLFGVLMAGRVGDTVAASLGDLMRLRFAGATWGLIARERRIDMKAFLALVIAALVPPSSPSASPGATSRPSPGGSPGPSGSPSPSGSPTDRPSGSPSPSPSRSPTPSPNPSPTCDPISLLLGRCGPVLGG